MALEEAAVPTVGTAFEVHVQEQQSIATLRACISSLNSHFADGIDRRIVITHIAIAQVGYTRSFDLEVRGKCLCAIYGYAIAC